MGGQQPYLRLRGAAGVRLRQRAGEEGGQGDGDGGGACKVPTTRGSIPGGSMPGAH